MSLWGKIIRVRKLWKIIYYYLKIIKLGLNYISVILYEISAHDGAECETSGQ